MPEQLQHVGIYSMFSLVLCLMTLVLKDMNEPSSFVDGSPEGCPNDRWHYPRYLPGSTNHNVIGGLVT